ncbi:hypothetical protein L3Q82_020053, partial [Scortum barcoo]
HDGSSFQLDGRLLFRADRTSSRGKPAGADYASTFRRCLLRLFTSRRVNEALKGASQQQHQLAPAQTPGAFHVFAGEFNHVNLTDTCLNSTSMSAYRHREITRWTVFTPTNEDAYRAVPHPHLGFMLLPAYRPLLRLTPPQRTISVARAQ